MQRIEPEAYQLCRLQVLIWFAHAGGGQGEPQDEPQIIE